MRISDGSSDVCSSDLEPVRAAGEDYVRQSPWPVTRGEPLFRGARGGPLSADLVRRAVRAARVRLGLPDSATPHALRHSFATHLLARSEEHTSELQSLLRISYPVFCLKKNKLHPQSEQLLDRTPPPRLPS